MKKNLAILFFILAMNGFSFAQSLISEVNKVKEIKLLESTYEDVKKILAGYEHDNSDDEYHKQDFSTKNAEIEITLARGDCSEDSEYWNVSKGIATKIEITFEEAIKLKDFNFDFSKYKKEIEDEESLEDYNYHDEDAGIIFEISEDEIQKIIFYPTKSKSGFLCDNENTSEIISGEKRFSDLIYDKTVCVLIPARVTNLTLSANTIIICNKTAKNKKCSSVNMKISVITEAVDPENDVLTYGYSVSGGKIIGKGKNVVWDLSGVQPGNYTITAGVDDGCGFCGETKTQTVVVKDCSDCSIK